jgi:hypothetical protein
MVEGGVRNDECRCSDKESYSGAAGAAKVEGFREQIEGQRRNQG